MKMPGLFRKRIKKTLKTNQDNMKVTIKKRVMFEKIGNLDEFKF